MHSAIKIITIVIVLVVIFEGREEDVLCETVCAEFVLAVRTHYEFNRHSVFHH